MADKRICITTDCACDLSEDILKRYNIDLMYFYIETEGGRFKDVDEITSQNIFEYLKNNGKRTETQAPPAEEFVDFFSKKLRNYDEIIHIAISSKISMCVKNSTTACSRMGEAAKRIHIFDSGHLSTGIGLLVLQAAEMVEAGCGSEEILAKLGEMRKKVSTTFMTLNADYLYRNGKVGRGVKALCSTFNIRPVLEMKDGYIKLKSVQIGDYEKSVIRYVKKELKNTNKIQKDKLFITHAGCSVSDLRLVNQEVNRHMSFEKIMVTQASATISGNSGPRTMGILFVRK